MPENNKEIEIVKGNGEDLNISPVYRHLNAAKPKTKKESSKNIILPHKKNDKKG